ncbi:hypothetical protein ABIE65_001409, partial [Constrictibacter sp. MBR-5]
QDTHDEPLRRSLDAAPPAHPFHSINFFNSKAGGLCRPGNPPGCEEAAYMADA